MSLTLNLSEEEARNLAEMLAIVGAVVVANQRDDAEVRVGEWCRFLNKLMEQLAQISRLSHVLTFDDESKTWNFSEEYEASAFYRDCLEEYRENLFWSDLVTRLADRAITEQLGAIEAETMSEEEKRRMTESLEAALWQECMRFGIDRLGFIVPIRDA